MATTNLEIREMADASEQKFGQYNQGVDEIDRAFGNILGVAIDNSNAASITATQLRRNFFFNCTEDSPAPTGPITLTVPGSVSRGAFAILNNTSFDITVTILGQSVTPPVVTAGQTSIVVVGGTNVRGLEAGVSSFLALLDTPASFSGQNGKVLIADEGNNAVAFGPNITPQLSASSFGHTHIGALLERTSSQSIPDETDTLAEWQAATYDTTFSVNNDGSDPQKFWLGVDLNFTAATNDNITATTHDMQTGDGPLRVTTTGTLPSPLATGTNYWVIRVDANTIQLATSRANALAGTQIDITTTGSGTHTLDRATRFVVPEGVTKIKLSGGARLSDPGETGNAVAFLSVQKNESFVFDGRPELSKNLLDNNGSNSFTIKSPALEVVEGDFFELNIFQNNETEDNALNLLNGSFTYFGIEVVESTKTTPFPQVMVEKPFEGALLELTSNIVDPVSVSGTFVSIDWDQATYDTGHNGTDFAEFVTNPNRITIPSGVTKVRLKGHLATNGVFSGTTDPYIALFISKSGSSSYAGRAALEIPVSEDATGDDVDVMFSTAVLEVAAGDWFDVQITSNDTSFTVNTNSWFAVEVVETTEVLTFPGVTVERPQIGALVNKTDSAQSISATTTTKVTFNNTVYDTGFRGTALFDNANDQFLIPAGVKKVRLMGGVNLSATSDDNLSISFRKNGSNFPGSSVMNVPHTGGTDFLSTASPTIEVAEGDTLELAVFADTGLDVQASADSTVFAIEIVETEDAAQPPEEVYVFMAGTPATDDMVYLKVANRRFSLADDFAGSDGYAITAPSGGAIVFDVRRDATADSGTPGGTLVGTVTFGDGNNTATFSTSGGSQEDWEDGERLSIHSPSNLQGAANISINLKAFRT